MRGPGIGDNAAAVVCAVQVVEQLARERAAEGSPSRSRSARRASATSPARAPPARRCEPEQVLALEGHGLLHVAVDAVGSLRARITVRGPGGHSWANRGRPSAIDEVCRIARALSRQPRRRGEHEHRPHPGRHGGQRDRGARRARDRAARARRDAARRASRARSQRARRSSRRSRSRSRSSGGARPGGSTAASRCSRPCAACARSSACPTSWSRPPPTPTPRSPRASPRSASAARTGGEMHTPGRVHRDRLAGGRARAAAQRARAPLLWDESAAMTAVAASARPARAPTSSSARSPACAARATLADAVRFVSVELRDPDKAELAAWRAGGAAAAARGARSSCSPTAARTRRSSALDDDALVAWEHVPGVHAAITADEYAESEVAVKADAGLPRGARAARRATTSTW